jgi:lipid-binding SYLF domain-containing protein
MFAHHMDMLSFNPVKIPQANTVQNREFILSKRPIILATLFTALLFFCGLVQALGKNTQKVKEATEVLRQVMAIPEDSMPPALLHDAHAIAIIPGVIKVGFVVGGRYGSGIMALRDDAGQWSNPCFITLTGGSIGWQAGAQSTDVILVFKSKRSIEGIMEGKFTLGADAAIAAGPVGRRAEAATDTQLKVEVYSYSRSRGLFVGMSLEGAALQINEDANAAFYGMDGISPKEIFAGTDLKVPEAGVVFKEALTQYSLAAEKEF